MPSRASPRPAHRTATWRATPLPAHSSKPSEGSRPDRDGARCATWRRPPRALLEWTYREYAPSSLELCSHPLELADDCIDDAVAPMFLGKHVPGIGFDLEMRA